MRRRRDDAPVRVHANSNGDGRSGLAPTSLTAADAAWMTPRQAALYLGVGVDTIYDACATDALKHVKLGYRTIRLRREWIDRWAEQHASPIEWDGGA